MSHFIPSIFNYCDRWCERCAFIGRCSLGVMEQKRWAKGENWEISDFYDYLEEVYPRDEDKMNLWVQELELTLRDIDPYENLPLSDLKAHTLEQEMRKRGADYNKPLQQFLHDNQEGLKVRGIDLFSEKVQRDGPDTHERSALAEALEIILCYQHFMFIKANRAIGGLAEMHEGLIEGNALQSDANGSAKVAMIAAERSLGAWELLRRLWPEKQADALVFMRKINTFRHSLAQIFPEWEKFVRPGFDTEKAGNFLHFGDN